jgi:hypothetical protein
MWQARPENVNLMMDIVAAKAAATRNHKRITAFDEVVPLLNGFFWRRADVT